MRLSKSAAASATLFIYSTLAAHAQLAPFTPSGFSVPALSSTTASQSTTMPAGTQSVLVQNVGTDAVFCAPGPTATSNGLYLSASGGSFIFPLVGTTNISCIDQSTTSTVNFIPGSGFAVVASGGGGGGGTSVPNPLPISATTLPLPTGAATAANQATQITAEQAIQTNTANYNDPCAYSKKSFARFQGTSGTLANVPGISAVSGNFIYVCSITLTTSTQVNFGLLASTTTACGGSPYDVWGDIVGAAAATGGFLFGPGVSTAGGISAGNGGAEALGVAGTANSFLCYEFTTTNSPTVTFQIAYVQTTN